MPGREQMGWHGPRRNNPQYPQSKNKSWDDNRPTESNQRTILSPERVPFETRPWIPHPRVRIRMNVVAAVSPSSSPRRRVEINAVRAPTEVRMRPSPREERRGDHDGRAETNGPADEKSRRRRPVHDEWIVSRNVDVSRIRRQNFDVVIAIDDIVVGTAAQISVTVCLLPLALYCVHHIRTLREYRVA